MQNFEHENLGKALAGGYITNYTDKVRLLKDKG